MNLYYGRPEHSDYRTVIDQYSDSELQNLTSSTIPLLSYWKKCDTAVSQLLQQMNIVSAENAKICFEYPVSVTGIRYTKASFSDVMYISNSAAIAIEAKRNEGEYDTVRKWLSMGEDVKHRKDVLNYWLRQVEKVCDKRLSVNNVSDITYQLIHRTASVCSLMDDNRSLNVLYQIFLSRNKKSTDKNKKRVDYESKMREMVRIIGSQGRVKFWIHEVVIGETKFYHDSTDELKRISWKNAKSEKAQFVRKCLLAENELFEFIREAPRRIEI